MGRFKFKFEMNSPPSWFWLAAVIVVAILVKENGEVLIRWI
ncbi:hypothetical protein [Nonomuraea sp. NPDC046570]